MKETIINLLESSWKIRKELCESDLPFPELLKRLTSMKNEFFDQIDLDSFWALLNSNPEVKKVVDDFNKSRYPYIVSKFLEKGRQEGYIRKEISLEAAMIHLTMYQEVLMKPEMQKKTNNELIKELMDLMLYGLAGQAIGDQTE